VQTLSRVPSPAVADLARAGSQLLATLRTG
jgi:hypothetical protein